MVIDICEKSSSKPAYESMYKLLFRDAIAKNRLY